MEIQRFIPQGFIFNLGEKTWKEGTYLNLELAIL